MLSVLRCCYVKRVLLETPNSQTYRCALSLLSKVEIALVIAFKSKQNEVRMSASILVAEAVWKDIESTRSVSNDQLSILHFLFGKNFERATRIVDQRGVKRISGEPSGRFIFQCKHQLAARLAASLGACIEVKVSDEKLALLLSKL
ncbi:uncharacterized protein LOC126706913 isoform X2 [Quercus robur]|uniref:uncharacterized protein LOC126706913 isoform X2 n=1 Tax=Quercus robur TaxID=38942 RepID=UPI002163087A|nr:uncharacterized protein LOC126706913 isoform X2 [Quercus robur]